MKKLTTFLAAVALVCSMSASAQEMERDYNSAYWFGGIQAGYQVTLTHYQLGEFQAPLYTPQYAIQFGRYFNNKFGARVHLMGLQNRTGFAAYRYNFYNNTWPNPMPDVAHQDYDFNYKAFTGDVDFLVNMTNVIKPQRKHHWFDWVLEIGLGVNATWDYDDAKNFANSLSKDDYEYAGDDISSATVNFRMGTQFNFNIAEHWTLGLEAQANMKGDSYNIKFNGTPDWQIALLAGVSYNFGYKKVAKVVPVKEPVYATRIDTIWYDDVTYKTVPSDDKIEKNIRFQIRKSDVGNLQEVKDVEAFISSHKDCKVTVTGYADKGTGNKKLNLKYSKQRAQAVTKALTTAGVPAEIITTDWKGDTVQPFANNDDNRVVITVAAGTGEKQEKVVTKKFKTQEVRYEVK